MNFFLIETIEEFYCKISDCTTEIIQTGWSSNHTYWKDEDNAFVTKTWAALLQPFLIKEKDKKGNTWVQLWISSTTTPTGSKQGPGFVNRPSNSWFPTSTSSLLKSILSSIYKLIIHHPWKLPLQFYL